MGNLSMNQFGVIEKFKQDEFIFHEGEIGAEMYIMLSGKADVYINSFDDMPIKVHEIVAGDFFGEMALLDDLPRSASIYASEDITVMKIERKDFNNLISTRPDIAYKMMKTLSNRLRKTNDELTNRDKVIHHEAHEAHETHNQLNEEDKLINQKKSDEVHNDENDQSNLEDQEKCSKQTEVYIKETKFDVSKIFPKKHKLYTYNPYDEFYDSNVLNKSAACPICNEEFTADMVKNSRLQFSHEEKFFRKKFRNVNPLVSMVWTCPRCFYSNYYYEFNTLNSYKIKNVKSVIGKISYSAKIRNSKTDNINTVFLKYYLMLHIEENSRPSTIKLAKIWLNLFWLYEDVGDIPMKEYAFKKTQELYKNAYYNCNIALSKDEELRLGILVAELTAENGELEIAYRLLSKILVDKRLSQILKNRASSLMYEYKNIIKNK